MNEVGREMSGTHHSLYMRWQFVAQHAARWSIEQGGNRVEVLTSYVADSFSELMRVAADVRAGAEGTFAVLGGEPAGSVVFVLRTGNQCLVRVVSFAAMSAAMTRFIDGTLRWSSVVDSKSFVDAVVRMGDRVLREHGLEGFERRWGHPFPTTRLAKLRDGLTGSL